MVSEEVPFVQPYGGSQSELFLLQSTSFRCDNLDLDTEVQMEATLPSPCGTGWFLECASRVPFAMAPLIVAPTGSGTPPQSCPDDW